MRDFFIMTLKDLKRNTGVGQYEAIAAIPDKTKAQEELNLLLASLLEVCDRFTYIPDVDKGKIIKARIIDSNEFYGLNAKFVFQSLNAVSGKYWKESGHIETNELLSKEYEPVPPPKEFIELMEKLGSESHRVPIVDLKEITPKRPKQDIYSIGVPFGTKEYYEFKELQRQWMLENTHPFIGKITGIEFSDWLKLQSKP